MTEPMIYPKPAPTRKKVAFAELHVFKYSMRHGTVAAKMENQVNDTVKAERSADLIKCGNELKHKYMEKFIGENAEVLFEEEEMNLFFTIYYLKPQQSLFCICQPLVDILQQQVLGA